MRQNSQTWEINGMQLSLDLRDADTMERYEQAFAAMEQEERKLPKEGGASAFIRAYCGLFRSLYDRIFGEGTAEQIFSGQPVSTAVYDEVYGSFLAFVRGQLAEVQQQRSAMLEKYRPNRESRRAAVKHPKKPLC